MEMRTGRSVTFFLLLILTLSALTFLNSCKTEKKEEIKLKLNFSPGQKYSYKIVTEQDINQNIQGEKLDIKQTIGMNYVFDVLEVDKKGNITIRATYESLSLSQHGAGENIEYNSTQSDTNIHLLARGLHALKGKNFMLQLSAEGDIKNVSGIDETFDELFAGSESGTDVEKDKLRESMKEQYGEDAIAQNMGSMLNIFPKDAIKTGDSWNRKFTLSSGYPLILENNYTLKKVKENLALITLKTEIKPDEKAVEKEMDDAKVNYNLSGTQQGELQVDKTSGLIINGVINQELNGSARLSGGPGMNLSWPLSIKSVTRIESKQIN